MSEVQPDDKSEAKGKPALKQEDYKAALRAHVDWVDGMFAGKVNSVTGHEAHLKAKALLGDDV